MMHSTLAAMGSHTIKPLLYSYTPDSGVQMQKTDINMFRRTFVRALLGLPLTKAFLIDSSQ